MWPFQYNTDYSVQCWLLSITLITQYNTDHSAQHRSVSRTLQWNIFTVTGSCPNRLIQICWRQAPTTYKFYRHIKIHKYQIPQVKKKIFNPVTPNKKKQSTRLQGIYCHEMKSSMPVQSNSRTWRHPKAAILLRYTNPDWIARAQTTHSLTYHTFQYQHSWGFTTWKHNHLHPCNPTKQDMDIP